MNLIQIKSLDKYFGATRIFGGVDLTLQEGARVALVGVNGAGKTTLMNLIAGADTPDAGTISLARDARIGYLKQNQQFEGNGTVWETLRDVYSPVFRMEQRLREMEQLMGQVHEDAVAFAKLSTEYDTLLNKYEQLDGYSWKSRIQGVLAGLGFREDQQQQDANTLSGGERTRLSLAQLLLIRPDLLLLDEPTNHLDLGATQWLEETLKTYPGTVMVISHDRYFMDAIATGVAELSQGSLLYFDGNYSAFAKKRRAQREQQEKAYELQQKEIARQEAIIERFRSYNREKSIRAAESREKALDRIERVEKPAEEHGVKFHFEIRRTTGQDVLMASGLAKRFDGPMLFENIDMLVRAGERVAILGPNGAGKSTLLKVLAGRLAPDGGEVLRGAGVEPGFFDQHHQDLSMDKRVIDELWDAFPAMNESRVRTALGAFLFRGDDVFQRVGTLSGGERGRLTLLKLMLRQHNLLLMDEPTNHLDMPSREVLEDALADYPGTLITVSHDRYFVNRIATRVLIFTPTGIEDYLGNYDDYIAAKNRPSDEIYVPDGPNRTQQARERKRIREQREQQKREREAVEAVEAQIAAMEQEIEDLAHWMAQPGAFELPEASDKAKRHAAAGEELEALYAHWEQLNEQLSQNEE